MNSPDIRFQATPTATGEKLELVSHLAGGMLRRTAASAIPVDEWISSAPKHSRHAVSRIFEALDDVSTSAPSSISIDDAGRGITLSPNFIATLSDSEATSLGLPPAARLSLNLQSHGVAHQPEFSIATRWSKPNGLPALVRVEGARIKYDGKDWRIPEPLWTTIGLVDQLNNSSGEADRQAALAKLRFAIGDEDRSMIKPDGFIEKLRLSYASGFSLNLQPSSNGFDFNPILFSPERMNETDDGAVLDEAADSLLPPLQQEVFTRRFRQGDGDRRAYLLDGGAILYLDPTLQMALKVVRRAQASGPDARRDFAHSPQRALSEALVAEGLEPGLASTLFIETQQFSDRVSGIDIWRKPVLPWVKPKPNSWLPESFGIRIGDPPDDTIMEIAPDQIEPALESIEEALKTDSPSVSIAGVEVPATEQSRKALSDLAELRAAADEAASGAKIGPPPTNRYFLQVSDNLEDVEYAPLAGIGADVDIAPPDFPEAVTSTPKPHQLDGFNWLAACWQRTIPGALLADDMGLGKTFQALAFLAWLRASETPPKPVLIVAPTGLLANWKAEIAQHLAPDALRPIVEAYGAGLNRVREVAGRDIELGKSAIDGEAWSHAGVVLTTFETMRDYHLSFARQPFAVIIYDEVQKLKNPASQMTRAAKTLNAKFQLAMTGTPVENRLQDLWSIFDVVHPGLLGSSKAFEASYPASDVNQLRVLNALLTEPQQGRPPLLLRRMKDDCLPGLPAKHVHALPLPMPAPQAAAYERIIQRAMFAKGTGQRGMMLEILHMLRGVSLHPFAPADASSDYFTESARLTALFSTLDAIRAKGEKTLIFCESLAMQALLAGELRRRYSLAHDVLRIHGGVAGEARQIAVNTFQRRPSGFDVMILSPKAGGVGLTLTAANHVIHLSRWWNPAVEDQATDRAFRIGQTRDVHVYLPQAVHPDAALGPSSFDLKLDVLMRRKRELSRGLLIPGEDEADTSALFDSIVQGDEAADGPETSATSSEHAASETLPSHQTPPPTSDAVDAWKRQTLSAKPVEAASRAPGPLRYVFEPRSTRDFSIFTAPIAGDHLVELLIKDPYACARSQNRQMLVDFIVRLTGAARSIDGVTCHTLDADSVDYCDESDKQQEADLDRRWRSAFSSAPTLRHVQISKRINRAFHAREITAKLASGRKILWDLDNGIDGVMRSDKRCVVGCFPDQ